MLAKQQLVLDQSDFLRGMSSAPHIADGGFGPDSEAVNPILHPGVLYAPAAAVDSDTDDRLSTTIEIIASSPDMANLGVDDRLLVGVDSDDFGTFYRYDGTKIIAVAYAEVFTVTIATPAVFTSTAHGLAAGDRVKLRTTGALPTGLSVDTVYFVISAGLTADAFQLSTTDGGAAINTSGTQSGTHRWYTRNYIKGYTDIITYRGETYVTAQQHITRWQNDNTIDQKFYAFTTANVPHPAIVFEDNAYYGDNNLLLRQTAVAGTPATILTLAVGEIIIALGVEPGSGKMLIATTSSLNMSNTLTSINKLYWYDGSSNKTLKVIYIEDQIFGVHSVGGITYCGYGQNLGYVTGSGIKFLRKLINVNLNNEQLPYKHNLTSIGSTLYVADGNKILAYGPVRQGGGNVFYYCARNKVNDLVFQSIFNAGSNKIGYSFIGEFRTVDLSSKANLDKFDFRTVWYKFSRPVYIREVRFEYNDSIASTGNFAISYFDQSGTGSKSLNVFGTITSTFEFRVIGFQEKLTAFKLRIENSTENDGLKRMIVYYDFAE